MDIRKVLSYISHTDWLRGKDNAQSIARLVDAYQNIQNQLLEIVDALNKYDERVIFANIFDEKKDQFKGDKGDKGNTGRAFTYDDFTPEQLASLKGDRGPEGPAGKDGKDGQDGQDGIVDYTLVDTKIATARSAAIRSRCPWFNSILSSLDNTAIDDYPNESVYNDCSIVFYEDKFYLYDNDLGDFYTKWIAFGSYSDCDSYMEYIDNHAKPGIYYCYDTDGVFCWDLMSFFEIKEQEQADWNQNNSSAFSYIKNKPSNLADKGHVNRMLVIDGISDSITNFGTGYPPSGITVLGIYYSKSNKRMFAKGSNNNYYAKWNEATVANYLRPSFEYYSYNTPAVGGIYHNLADGYNYYIKYNVSTPVKLPGFSDIPAAPLIDDFFGNSFLKKIEQTVESGNHYTVSTGYYNIIDLDSDGVNNDITLELKYEIGTFSSSEICSNYLFQDITSPESIVEIHTASNSNTEVTVVDSDGNTLLWLTPAIGVLDSNSVYLLSIVDGTAGMIKLEERTTA